MVVCCHAECHLCRMTYTLSAIMLSVIVLSVIMLNVITLSVVTLNVIWLTLLAPTNDRKVAVS
jgi:hypothetical protein